MENESEVLGYKVSISFFLNTAVKLLKNQECHSKQKTGFMHMEIRILTKWCQRYRSLLIPKCPQERFWS